MPGQIVSALSRGPPPFLSNHDEPSIRAHRSYIPWGRSSKPRPSFIRLTLPVADLPAQTPDPPRGTYEDFGIQNRFSSDYLTKSRHCAGSRVAKGVPEPQVSPSVYSESNVNAFYTCCYDILPASIFLLSYGGQWHSLLVPAKGFLRMGSLDGD